ncbi:hypothetical protein AAG570_008373 [Ranatra chinensis]|uniref:Dynein intermediate chain 3, ciliary n=1 Tax=Ranatra chinensis TaxID=642074 RepID=A0ABD0XSY6_9HEMI
MDTQYTYTKSRRDFGRPYLFVDDGPKLIQSIPPQKELMENFVVVNPTNKATQVSKSFSLHEVNTVRAEYTQTSMNHTEGGWPKDINFQDSEQTLRFRKKIEKDEMYTHTLLQLLIPMEHYILQNNAINIYELYFMDDNEQTDIVEISNSRTVNVFRDPNSIKRPVSHICWSPDKGTRLAVAHSNLNFQRIQNDQLNHSYIWHTENPNKPELVIDAGVPVVCLEYNPRDINSLIGGLYNGQVAFWDTRKGSEPVDCSDHYQSFRDPVISVLWVNSKSGMEFFSAATDGQVKWWDVRKFSKPLETLILDTTKGEEQLLNRALGASCLEYEPTIPTRFMVGTEKGLVICGNRKGKTAGEKLAAQYKAHHGPVWSLQRNPSFLKNFLTVGDWTARIWSEDCKESSIIWTSYHKTMLTRGAWSNTRSSVFYTTRIDGTLDIWDILLRHREPCLSIKVCDESLHALKCHDNGELVVVGNDIGNMYVIEVSENFVRADKNDKAYLTAMFDRESRREKIIEGRMREQRLKMRTKQDVSNQKENVTIGQNVTASAIKSATNEFFAMIDGACTI